MTPLLTVTLALTAGLLAGFRASMPMWTMLALCMSSCAVLIRVRARTAAVATFCIIGIVVGSLRSNAVAHDCRTRLNDGAHVLLTGFPMVVPTEGVTIAFRAHTLRSGSRHCAGLTVRVRAAPRHHAVLDSIVGERAAVRVQGRWMSYPSRGSWPRNPEYAGAILVDAITRDTTAAGADAITRVRTTQQRRLRALLPQTWGLAESLLLAENAGVTPDVRMRWVSSGLVHLLAISGMHVGLIAAGTLFVCAMCGVAPRSGRRIALLVSTAYVLFLGAPSAAMRSLLQAYLLLGSIELQRPAEPFTALAAAGLGILVLEPLALLDVGFQLSFAGMIGLVGWRRTAMNALPQSLHPWVRDGLASGIAATALTTPVAALHFGTASWIGIPATLIAAPLFAAVLAMLALLLLLCAFSEAAAGPVAWTTDITLRILDHIAGAAAAVPGGHGYIAWTTVMCGLVAAATAIIVRARRRDTHDAAPPVHATAAAHEHYARRGRRRTLAVATAVVAGLAVIAWAPLLLRESDGSIEIHAIDVGQGDAFAVRTAAGRWLLIDTGPRSARSDAGRDRIVPYLLRRGARRLEALVLTHPDADHIGGAGAVLDAFDVGVVIDPGLAAGKDMFIELLDAARRSRQRWIAGRAGVSFDIDGVGIAVLYPDSMLDTVRNANDNSVVLRLTWGTFAALFTGDAPASVEDRLIDRYGARLDVDLLKVGHHGSATSTGAALLAATTPSVALISAGRRNRYGHPSTSVLDRLEQHGIRVLRTDQRGTFLVRVARSGELHVLGN